MLRGVLLASLAAGVLASYDSDLIDQAGLLGGSIYGGGVIISQPTISLSSVLLPVHVVPALRLVQARYVGVSHLAAVHIVRTIFYRPHVQLLRAVQLTAVPVISQRLAFLETVFDAFPPVFYTDGYQRGFLSYVHGLGLGSVSSAQLLDPLALIDVRLATSLVAPNSISTFNSFCGSHLLYATGGYLTSLPALDVLYTRLQTLRLTPVPVGFHRITLGGSSTTSTVVETLQPSLTELGLTGLVQPTTVIGGLVDFLHSQRIPATQFVQTASTLLIPNLRTVVESIQIPLVLGNYLSTSVLRQDILPLLALRYYALPRLLRVNLPLQKVVPSFLSSLDLSGGSVTLSRGFISDLLTGFDGFIQSRAKGFNGRLWAGGIWGDW